MSTIVKDIKDAIETTIGTTLGVTWSVLDHKFDLEKNNLKNSTKRFGVKVLDGPSSIGILKHYTVNRTFQITFLTEYKGLNKSDTNQQLALDILEDAIDDSLAALINEKVGLPTKVINVVLSLINEPDFTIENMTFINLDLIISYRRQL